MNPNDEKIFNKAKMADQAERYEDMKNLLTEYVKTRTKPITNDERNLLSVAFKNCAGTKRSAWRIISQIEQKDKTMSELAKEYRVQIEKELLTICQEILNLINDHLLPKVTEDEAKVFYYKMKGDYNRYMAEIKLTSDDSWKNAANEAYETATDFASELADTHPIKLGLALNYSVFHYEILNNPQKACDIAKQSFDAAIKGLEDLKEDSYKDSTLIMQLIRDNLTLWTAEVEDEDENENMD